MGRGADRLVLRGGRESGAASAPGFSAYCASGAALSGAHHLPGLAEGVALAVVLAVSGAPSAGSGSGTEQ